MLATRTFIGSSEEGLVVANAIKANLSEVSECLVWTEGVFLPGRTFIETLEKLLDTVDYAILVATPDDMLRKRDVEGLSMRDNVLLELGLFMAKLGRSRTYLASPRDTPIQIPSDLLGITTVSYELPASSELAVAALALPCENIKRAMREAESELSLAMRRIIAKRLLTVTNRMMGLVVTLQSDSIRSLTNRAEFDNTKRRLAERVTALSREYDGDAAKLDVEEQARRLTEALVRTVESVPFPEESVITQDDVVGGLFSHLTGRRSASDQLHDRLAQLAAQYEQWWIQQSPSVLTALNDLQAALIASM